MTSDAAAGGTGQEPKARIFISYSRADTAFVDRLEAALKERGLESFVDRQDPVTLQDWSKGIAPFENWWDEIKRMIAQADTIVFVISPDSGASKYCQDELAEAAKLNKRLAPIVYRLRCSSRLLHGFGDRCRPCVSVRNRSGFVPSELIPSRNFLRGSRSSPGNFRRTHESLRTA